MAKLSVLLLLLVACLFAMSWAAPMEDLSETDIDITETELSSTKESFLVDVTRTDFLVSDDGDILAERLECVMIEFELDDDQLLINNVPVGLDITDITIIEAKIMQAPPNETLTDEEVQELDADFDIGLVTVEVTTSAESYPSEDPSYSLRLIKIAIRIIEIDGVDIVETEAIEKIFELKSLNDDSGDLTLGSNDTPADADIMATSTGTETDENVDPHAPCTLSTLLGRLRHWWKCSSRFTRVIITSIVLTSIFGLAFIALPTAAHALIIAARRRRGIYQQVAINEEEERSSPKNDQVIYIVDEEKRSLMTEQENKH
jgi:hypothetical protein